MQYRSIKYINLTEHTRKTRPNINALSNFKRVYLFSMKSSIDKILLYSTSLILKSHNVNLINFNIILDYFYSVITNQLVSSNPLINLNIIWSIAAFMFNTVNHNYVEAEQLIVRKTVSTFSCVHCPVGWMCEFMTDHMALNRV